MAEAEGRRHISVTAVYVSGLMWLIAPSQPDTYAPASSVCIGCFIKGTCGRFISLIRATICSRAEMRDVLRRTIVGKGAPPVGRKNTKRVLLIFMEINQSHSYTGSIKDIQLRNRLFSQHNPCFFLIQGDSKSGIINLFAFSRLQNDTESLYNCHLSN